MQEDNQDEFPPETMDVAGIRCYVYETTALEAWFMLNSLRQVLCSDEPPAQRGTLALVVTQPPTEGETDFIREMSRTGGCPPLESFLAIHGVVGVVDFHVEETTDLPGWDGASIPAILSNPRRFIDGELISAKPPTIIPDASGNRGRRERHVERGRHNLPPRSARRRRRR